MASALGQSTRRDDGEDKVRGTAVYGMDYEPAGALQAALLRSPVAAGRIRHLDVSKAVAISGVRSVLTTADVPATRSGWIVKDQPMFAGEEIRFLGEPIAAVAADTVALARVALEAIELDIEPLQPVLDLEAAVSDSARLLHPDWEEHVTIAPASRGGNVAWENSLQRGDVEAAFASAHLVAEDEFRTARQHQSPIEPHAAVAVYRGGRYIVHSPTQYPFLVRDRIAELMGVPPSAVRVVVPTIGGGFGGKIDALLEGYVCALARRTGRPVRIVNTRHEELTTAGPRENAIVRLRTAVSKTGEILAQEGEVLSDNGAYSGETVACTSVIPLILGGVYRVPACRYRVKTVYTNTPPTAAFRGVSGPYAVFAQEQHLDNIARKLGLDRRELRLRNVLHKGEAMVNGQVLEDAAIVDALDRLQKLAPWRTDGDAGPPTNGDAGPPTNGSRAPLRGTGIVPLVWITNPGPGGATVKLNEDGTVTVMSAGAEIGTGAMVTGVRQVVAEELGVSVDAVHVTEPDTDAAPYDAGAQGSRTMFAIGAAAQKATGDVRRQVLETASQMLEADAADIEIIDGRVQVMGAPSAALPLAAVAATATWTTGPIAATSRHIAPPIPFDAGCMAGALFTTFAGVSYHAHMAEVEVDPDTGKVTVTRYVVVQDVGRIVNPQMIEGQVHGGVLQGVGYALYEELRVQDGRVLDDNLEHYRLPTALEAPPIEVSLMEVPCSYGPFGAKGAAEPPIVPVAAAIASAVSDAIGHPIHSLPVTPFDVLKLLRGGAGNGDGHADND